MPEGNQTRTEGVKKESIPPPPSNNNTILVGTWCISASNLSSFRVNNGVISIIYRQYTFAENGSYTCNIKTFDPLMSSILLGREAGNYTVSGSSLTINPKKSVLEEWSKKNGNDEWGKLLKTQNVAPEILTYQFSKLFIPEKNEWRLILKGPNPTSRYGPFNDYEKNAWIYIATSPSMPLIKLPG